MTGCTPGQQQACPRRMPILVALVLSLLAAACATPAPRATLPPGTATLPPADTTLPTTLPTATEPILPAPPTSTPPAASHTASPTPDSTSTPPGTPSAALYTPRQRLGIGVSSLHLAEEQAHLLGPGWYLNWTADPRAYRTPDVEYVPMLRVRDGELWPNGEQLLTAVDALPGALWLIGNEPDVRWQDNTPAETYATAYHEAYTLLKARDPSCRVAIGAVSQPTPLRLRYLDQVLTAYQATYGEPMPVDVWNVHNFMLREERDSWGVDIPPGMAEQAGRLYEIADHDDLEIFRQQLADFRQWMKERGQQDKPLIVSEYGILMPTEYGFPAEQVERFMLDTFELMRTAVDPALGYPADGHRLVQRWCWFSLSDARYPTGNLLDPDGRLTHLGEAFATYAASLPER